MKNESEKKSLEKSKNVLEQKRKSVKQKICIKKDTHVYNNCYELRSRAINHIRAKIANIFGKQVAFQVIKSKLLKRDNYNTFKSSSGMHEHSQKGFHSTVPKKFFNRY